MTDEIATEALDRARRENHTWMWLLDRLTDYVDFKGCRPQDEERLLASEIYIEPVFLTHPSNDLGPVPDIIAAFRENAALWLSVAPTQDVVVMPRRFAEALIGALPPVGNSFIGTSLEAAEHAGRALLDAHAHRNRRIREDREMTEGERARDQMHELLSRIESARAAVNAASLSEKPADGGDNG